MILSRITIIAIITTMVIIITITIIIILIIIIIVSSSSYLTITIIIIIIHHNHHQHLIITIKTHHYHLIIIIKIIFFRITFRRSQQHDYLEVKALVPPLQACSTWRWRNRTHECQIDALSVVVVVVVDNEEPVSDRWMRMAVGSKLIDR